MFKMAEYSDDDNDEVDDDDDDDNGFTLNTMGDIYSS
jgi:hypothetical protein